MVDDLRKHRADLKEAYGFDIPEIPLVKKGDYGFLINNFRSMKAPLYYKLLVYAINTIFYSMTKKNIEHITAQYDYARKRIVGRKKIGGVELEKKANFDLMIYHELIHAYQHSFFPGLEERVNIGREIMKNSNDQQKIHELFEKSFIELAVLEGQAQHYTFNLLREQFLQGKRKDTDFFKDELIVSLGRLPPKENYDHLFPALAQSAPYPPPEFIMGQFKSIQKVIENMSDPKRDLMEKLKLGKDFSLISYPLGLFYFRSVILDNAEKGMSHSEIVIKTIKNPPANLDDMVNQAVPPYYKCLAEWKSFADQQGKARHQR